MDDNEVAYLAGALFGAGSDTVGISSLPTISVLTRLQTASAISITVMAAALHPEAQAKVQEELDSVIGSDRRVFVHDKLEGETHVS